VGFVLVSLSFLLDVGWFCLRSSLRLLVYFSYEEDGGETMTTMVLVLCLFRAWFVF
jgi:hypothetical protein